MVRLDDYLPEGWAAPENGLGIFGANLGSGQQRFWFVPKAQTSQEDLFDQVSGILLREIHPAALVRALYLYPPGSVNEELPECEGFMLLLGKQPSTQGSAEGAFEDALGGEYERLALLVIDELADTAQQHFPSP